jgi:hypothetical protein
MTPTMYSKERLPLTPELRKKMLQNITRKFKMFLVGKRGCGGNTVNKPRGVLLLK